MAYGVGTDLEAAIDHTFAQLVIPLFDVVCPDSFFETYSIIVRRELEAAKVNPEKHIHLASIFIRSMFTKGSKTDLEYDENRIQFCIGLLTARCIPDALVLRFIGKLMIHLRTDSEANVQKSFLEMMDFHFATLVMSPFSIRDEAVRLKVLTMVTNQLLNWAIGEKSIVLLTTLVEALTTWSQFGSVTALLRQNSGLRSLLDHLARKIPSSKY
ncbi:hypothetical protein PSACC_01853 [Paramicrosporidium saccamoebae]|uniref:Uncharacterized protein n=1 Tax=Paramicrosporidium saccamoebae TaxID=1246581 RepID=A0A2H9TKP8_9FUNG|nr:hypothetical protein PSACC_01853 [Paramicrosporidium saccamoebae]